MIAKEKNIYHINWVKYLVYKPYFSRINDNIILVVSQGYVAEVSNEHVILGNDVLATCKIPSFVGDLVDIIAWVDSQGSEYLPKNLGKS